MRFTQRQGQHHLIGQFLTNGQIVQRGIKLAFVRITITGGNDRLFQGRRAWDRSAVIPAIRPPARSWRAIETGSRGIVDGHATRCCRQNLCLEADGPDIARHRGVVSQQLVRCNAQRRFPGAIAGHHRTPWRRTPKRADTTGNKGKVGITDQVFDVQIEGRRG